MTNRHDFNLFDAFRIFDSDNRGFITTIDLKLGLHDLGVFPSQEDLDLFFARYDTNGDRRLRFSEFCKAFESTDPYYAGILNRRASNGSFSNYRRSNCFLSSTQEEFKHMWRTHFNGESAAESIRQRMNRNPSLNPYDCFGALDLDDNGAITKDELRRMIESRGFYVSHKEVSDLVEKFDKNKDGRISYSEVSLFFFLICFSSARKSFLNRHQEGHFSEY